VRTRVLMIDRAAARPVAAAQSRNSRGRLVLAAMVAVLAVAVSFVGSAAALEWSAPVLVDGHVPRGAPHSAGITTLSCPSVSLCVAFDSEGYLVMSSTPAVPTSWTVVQVRGADSPTGVSCPSVSLCVAVDVRGVLSSSDPSAGAGAWHHARVVSAADPSAISCPSVSFCVAVDRAGAVLSSTDPTGGSAAWHVRRVDTTKSPFDPGRMRVMQPARSRRGDFAAKSTTFDNCPTTAGARSNQQSRLITIRA
jgi:hypothetical protein